VCAVTRYIAKRESTEGGDDRADCRDREAAPPTDQRGEEATVDRCEPEADRRRRLQERGAAMAECRWRTLRDRGVTDAPLAAHRESGEDAAEQQGAESLCQRTGQGGGERSEGWGHWGEDHRDN
jgi:hypothetical protein